MIKSANNHHPPVLSLFRHIWFTKENREEKKKRHNATQRKRERNRTHDTVKPKPPSFDIVSSALVPRRLVAIPVRRRIPRRPDVGVATHYPFRHTEEEVRWTRAAWWQWCVDNAFVSGFVVKGQIESGFCFIVTVCTHYIQVLLSFFFLGIFEGLLRDRGIVARWHALAMIRGSHYLPYFRIFYLALFNLDKINRIFHWKTDFICKNFCFWIQKTAAFKRLKSLREIVWGQKSNITWSYKSEWCLKLFYFSSTLYFVLFNKML